MAEMLQALDDDLLTLLAEIFRNRLLNKSTWAADEAWDLHFVKMLRKKGFANRVKDFRPIAVLPVLFKLYSRVLLQLCPETLTQLVAPQFAFGRQYQAHEVVFILRNLIEKSLEWDTPLFVLDGDLLKAYDFTEHGPMIDALLAKKVPRILVAAWVREVRRCKSIFQLESRVASVPVTRSRSLLQGDPAAPSIFNATLDIPASAFLQQASHKGWGCRLDSGTYISLVLYADNFWLFAKSPAQLAEMTLTWLEILRKSGWDVPLREATWCTTGHDDNQHWQVLVQDVAVPRALRAVGFQVLGAQVTFDNCFEVELQNRFARAWRAFYKYRHLLCCKTAPIASRFRLLASLVENALFWCSGSWNLTARQIQKLRGIQQSMLEKMVAVRRHTDETMGHFMERFHSRIKQLKMTSEFLDWDRRYHKSVYEWAGHVAHMRAYDSSRLTVKVLLYRDWHWIQQISTTNRGSQLHGRRFRMWRWEKHLYKFFQDESWIDCAQDKDAWNQQLDSFIDWRCGGQ